MYDRVPSVLAQDNSTGEQRVPLTRGASTPNIVSPLALGDITTLFIHVRNRNISVAQLEATLRVYSRADFMATFSAHVRRYDSTLVHELMRTGSAEHVCWIAKNTPELMHATEPQTKSTPLHTAALMRADADCPMFLKNLWRRAQPAVLRKRDSAHQLVRDYLEMKGRLRALKIVDVLGKPPAAAAPRRDASQLELQLAAERRSNRQLQHNHDASESTAEELQMMHAALDAAIRERDVTIAARDLTITNLNDQLARMQAYAAGADSELARVRDEVVRVRAELARTLKQNAALRHNNNNSSPMGDFHTKLAPPSTERTIKTAPR